jgi:hypothetical protein
MKTQVPYLFIGLIFVLLFSCSSTESEAMKEAKIQQFNELKELVEDKSFKFIAETAHPMQTYAVTQVTNALLRNTGNSSGTIFLTGRGDYIKVMKDTVSAELSYFGEVRFVGSIDPSDSGINFDEESLNFTTTENEKKKTLNLEFDVNSKTDRYNVIMQIYPSKRTNVIINSSKRTSIRYGGKIVRLEGQEKTSKKKTL